MAGYKDGKQGAEHTEYFLIGDDSGQALRIYQRRMLVAGLRDLALKDTSRCLLALLLGRHSPEGDWVDVSAAVRVRAQEDGQYGESVWRVARATAEQRYPNLEVVGWASSHPNMGLALLESEKDLHARYFKSPYQVFYVSDPVSNERCFYYTKAGALTSAGGFRVYGNGENEKLEPKMEQSSVNKHQDDRMRDRYLEHGLDKVIKRLDSPSMRNIDWAFLGLLILVLGIVLLRPQPAAKMDADLVKKIEVISTNVSEVNSRVSRLEAQLKAVNAIDAELKLPGAVTDAGIKGTSTETTDGVVDTTSATSVSGTTSTSTDSTTATSSTKTGRKVGGVEVGSKVSLHTIASGDTLYSICEQYYGHATEDLCNALGSYNKLTPPNYDLFPGEKLKIPAESTLSQAQ